MMPGNPNQPIFILKEGTERNHGRVAQSNNIAAAKAVAESVRTTLGPRGMDKMLVDEGGDVIVTNDGATILREMDIDHPAAKMIIEVAKTQEQECYDGTTSAVILSGELLKKAEGLIEQNIHPTTICAALRGAGIFVSKELNDNLTIDTTGNEVLWEVAKTSLTGKSAGDIKDYLGKICVDVVHSLAKGGQVNLDEIMVVKALGGEARDSELLNGLILDKERCHRGMPIEVANPAVALIDIPLEVKGTEMDANIQITDPEQISAFLEKEEQYLRDLVRSVVDSGANVLVCQKKIDDLAKHYLNKAGVLAVEAVKRSDMEALSRCLVTEIVTNLDDLNEFALGECERVEESKIGELPMLFFHGPKNDSTTLLLRGGTVPYIEEIERAFEDAIGVVSVAYADKQVLTGGGSTYAALSKSLKEYADSNINGRERMAYHAFADALEVIPRTLIENAGLDPVDEMMSLRTAHLEGNIHHGVNLLIENGDGSLKGGVMDMSEYGIYEPRRVVEQAIKSAVETAVMILRIDDVISSRKAGPQ